MDEKQRNKVLLLLFVGVLMGALDIAIVGPALPAIEAEFGVGSRQMAWVFNIYVLFSLIATPLMAKLSDRFGRRGVYMLDVALFGAGSLIVASATSYPMLLTGRAVQAMGAGGVMPVAAAVIGDTFPADKRGGALGLIGAVFGMAFIIGPVLAGFLLKYASWHWLFLINLPIALALIIASARMLPATRPAQVRPFDLAGVALLSTTLGAFALGITGIDQEKPLFGLLDPLAGGPIILALILAPIFWSVEKRAADPVLQPRLFRSKQMNVAGLIAVGTGISETSGVFLPLLAVTGLGMSPHQASFWMIPTVIALIIGSPIAGRLLDRIGSKVVVQGGLLLTAVGFYVFGAAQGLLAVVLSIGQLTGAALVGAIAASLGNGAPGYKQGFIVIAVIMTATTFVAFGLKNRAAERATAAAPAA